MKRETKEVTCIICPKGCKIRTTVEGENIIKILGNACPEGREYAIQEIKSPSRTIMSVVRCENCDVPTVSVKTSSPIPKEKTAKVMEKISEIEVKSEVKIGEILSKNIGGTEANLVATRNISRMEKDNS